MDVKQVDYRRRSQVLRSAGRWRWLPWFLAFGAGAAVPVFLAIVRTMGRNIPQPAIEADYAAAVVWAAVLALLLMVAPVPARDRTALLVLWGAKVFVTLGFMLFYEYSYGLDSYMYFSESLKPHLPQESGSAIGGGTELMVVLAWYHNWVFPNSYHTLKVTCAMVGLAGIYLTYRGARLYRPATDVRLLYIVGLFPSVLFWSSVLGKDPIVLFGIALYAYGTIGWSQHRRPGYLMPLVVGVWIAANIRLWLGPILLLPLVVIGLREVRGAFRKLLLLGAVLAVVSAIVTVFRDRLAIMSATDVYALTERLAEQWDGGSAANVDVQFTGIGSMLAFLPQGTFRALFRPLPGEVMNPFGLLAGVENVGMLALAAFALVRLRRARLDEPLVQWAFALILCWAGVYGFVSANLGAAVRFKLQILPTLLCLLLYLSRKPVPRDPGGLAGNSA